MSGLVFEGKSANSPVGSVLAQDSRSEDETPVVPFGQQLINANLINETDLVAALQLQSEKGQKLGETLLELGVISEEQLLPVIEKQIGVNAVRLREGVVDPKAVHLIPQTFALRENVLAMFKVRDQLTVAMAEPGNLQKIDEIERITNLNVNPVFSFANTIERISNRCYEKDFSVDAVTADLEDSAVEVNDDVETVTAPSLEQLSDGSPTVNLVNFVIVQALRQGASDIHIEPGRKNSSVRYRVDGQLVETLRPRQNMHAAIISRIKVMGKLDIAEQRAPQDGRCQVLVEGKEIDLRISTLPTIVGEKAVIRVLDRSRLTFNLNDLGMGEELLPKTKKLLKRPHGLLLVTGPTGSGKTTTLYSALELIKSIHRNIVTIEDPVEYQLEQINQVQADGNRSLNFASALRSILRQDPDVIMVGEIRDAETAAMAVQAALTGHLVLSTLHTNDAAGAITRLMDMGVEPYKVAASLAGVIAQRLVRKICLNCRSIYYPPTEYLQALHYQGESRRSFCRGEGCRSCYDSGFKGRVGIYEVMEIDQQMRELIGRDPGIDSIRTCFQESGGQTLLDSAIKLAEQEVTSLDEVAKIVFVE
ncbi:MAG: ATPase, T2SS/T4P/T4SS family [Planctomycetota bacterium]|nr:ATPase, T2SS/T4P/T4SS family [Planctomycetota bacterium]